MLFIKKQDDSVSVRTHSCMTIIHNDSSISKSYRYTYIYLYIYTVHSYPVFQLLTDLTGIVKKYIANTHINSFFFLYQHSGHGDPPLPGVAVRCGAITKKHPKRVMMCMQ
jgi:hypothetical protein